MLSLCWLSSARMRTLLWHCWLGVKKSIQPVKKFEWWGAGMVVCLEQVQMICIWSNWRHCHPNSSCFIKIQIGLTYLVPAYPGCPGKEAVKWVSVWIQGYMTANTVTFGNSHPHLQQWWATAANKAWHLVYINNWSRTLLTRLYVVCHHVTTPIRHLWSYTGCQYTITCSTRVALLKYTTIQNNIQHRSTVL